MENAWYEGSKKMEVRRYNGMTSAKRVISCNGWHDAEYAIFCSKCGAICIGKQLVRFLCISIGSSEN